jgi:hypothetical protein
MHVKRKEVHVGWMWMIRLRGSKKGEARRVLQMEAVLLPVEHSAQLLLRGSEGQKHLYHLAVQFLQEVDHVFSDKQRRPNPQLLEEGLVVG